MLINSAHLMGGSSEPDGIRGFGRIYLAAGLPINGTGDIGLFVADSGNTSISQNAVREVHFALTDDDTRELRATLTWIDPPSSKISGKQLVHDLDLTVTSPSGKGIIHKSIF